MGYKIDKDGVIIRPGQEGCDSQNRVSNQIGKDAQYYSRKKPATHIAKVIVFSLLGLLTLTIALFFLIFSRQGIGGKPEIHHFVGKVGNDVHMSIIIDGTKVTGKYYYDAIGKPIMLQGEKTGNNLHLTESYEGKRTGWFEGNLVSGGYQGSFTLAKNRKVTYFDLVETEGGLGFFAENEIER